MFQTTDKIRKNIITPDGEEVQSYCFQRDTDILRDSGMDKYKKVIHKWDEIFRQEGMTPPQQKESGNRDFDKSLLWLTEAADSVIDFGCAAGVLLFLCSHYGTTRHIGIDLSPQAIVNAQEKGKQIPERIFSFICGGVDALESVESSFADAAILSNIIDNLYPEDAHHVLREMRRILKPGGRLLVKLNPFMTPEQIKEWGVKAIEGNLLDDGMILWNNSTKE
ncbi:MAG: class I SAM-dependent methyltransferase [Ruminococcus sp.]|nr:class I SAM-dependent methyltransferase [Ruminococcus sp.]